MITKAIKVITVVVVMFFVSNVASAQFAGGSTPGGGGGGGGLPPAGVPFDGGLSIILIAAGAGLARRNKQNA